MFGIGLPEFILIMALALIVVGPDKLPGLAKTVAKQILELKKAANSLKDSLQDELAEENKALKELTSGLEGVDVPLANLASANADNEAETSTSQEADNSANPYGEEDVDKTSSDGESAEESKATEPPRQT
jgi:sec-independent protein translocase protein TatB